MCTYVYAFKHLFYTMITVPGTYIGVQEAILEHVSLRNYYFKYQEKFKVCLNYYPRKQRDQWE